MGYKRNNKGGKIGMEEEIVERMELAEEDARGEENE